MGPVLATEGELRQTASRTKSRQCVKANGAGAVASDDGKQTNKSTEGRGSNTLPYCSAIWVLLKIRRNWYKSLRGTQKAD